MSDPDVSCANISDKHREQSFEELRINLCHVAAAHGSTVYDVPSDGNCMLHATLDQIVQMNTSEPCTHNISSLRNGAGASSQGGSGGKCLHFWAGGIFF